LPHCTLTGGRNLIFFNIRSILDGVRGAWSYSSPSVNLMNHVQAHPSLSGDVLQASSLEAARLESAALSASPIAGKVENGWVRLFPVQ
jgi:hypothetical protein